MPEGALNAALEPSVANAGLSVYPATPVPASVLTTTDAPDTVSFLIRLLPVSAT
jgi:hypothetical protein